MGDDARHILVVSHTERVEALDAAARVCEQLAAAGVTPVLGDHQEAALAEYAPQLPPALILGRDVGADRLESAVVLGGDGTILHASELVRGHDAPLLGVNLGHIGFLAEAERDHLTESVTRLLERDYTVEDRMALDVTVTVDGSTAYTSWALNEATVEKASRERMIEVVMEVDERPVASFSGDGAIMATATGSTAYSFSAGGPVVWPSLDAMLLVPLSAHALFARPLVVGPESTLAVEVVERCPVSGVLWCDGRRSCELPPGSRVVVRRSSVPVRLARLHRASFTDRLVRKFELPVQGWRGPRA